MAQAAEPWAWTKRHPIARLGSVAVVQSGLTLDSGRILGGTTISRPYLRVANVQDGWVDLSELKEVEIPLAQAYRWELRAGDVLMTEGGDPDKLGRGSMWQGQVSGCLHQNHIFAVRPGPELHPRYLAFLTQASNARAYFEATASKTTGIASTSSNKISSFRIPLPPIANQVNVVNFLDAETARFDALISKKRHLLDLLIEKDKLVIDLELDELYRQFGQSALRHAIKHIEQGTSPQCDSAAAADGEWGVLKVSSVKDGRYWPRENKRLPEGVILDRRLELRPGDFLVTRANTPSLVGSAAVVDTVRTRLILCDKIFRIEVSDDFDTNFLVYVSRGTRIRGLCAAACHGTSQSMTNLKASDIKEWPIPAAPKEVQCVFIKHISAQLGRTSALRGLIRRQLDYLAEHRQALITAAVNGELDVAAGRARAGAGVGG